ncbi:MAG: hypothetical protein ACRDHJ_11040, partial [Actinomycetota bacterium]
MRGAGAALLLVLLLAAPESAQEAPDDRALLVLVDGLTYEGALADPVIGSLARAGGIGLMTNAERLTPPDPLPGLVVWRLQADTAGRIADVLGEVEGEEALVIVAGAGSVGTATPIVLAPGRPGDLLEAAG